MSLLADRKLFLGAVGVALTSAVAGFGVSRIFNIEIKASLKSAKRTIQSANM